MNFKPVIAIGLDAADPLIIEKWMAQGYLKNLSAIRRAGIYGRLINTVDHGAGPVESISTERNWVMFNTGCRPHKTGYWEVVSYSPSDYSVDFDKVTGGYDFREYAPFYALGKQRRVAVFDIPVTALSANVNGLQLLGWGGHFPFTPSHSLPGDLYAETIARFGKNPVLHNDSGAWWDATFFHWLRTAIKTSVQTRTAICQEFLRRGPWDLFMVTFGETHTAGHEWWHLSQPDHPLYTRRDTHGFDGDPMLETFQDVDRAIGDIVSAVSPECYVLCFAVHGMQANVSDQLSMMVLPEFLYRYSFPGRVALAPGRLGSAPPSMITRPKGRSWIGEIWRTKFDPNPLKRLLRPWTPGRFLHASGADGLVSPYVLGKRNIRPSWMPAMWYSPLWRQMKAFAIPAFAEGFIRINLKGREADGIVAPTQYDAICDDLTHQLMKLRDARTGEGVVKRVVPTRRQANDDHHDARLPPADLVVYWQKQPTDVVDSPELGRIGPIPFFRTGGHRATGFVMAKGPGIAAGSALDGGGEAVDLPPTIVRMLDMPIPAYFDGKPLWAGK